MNDYILKTESDLELLIETRQKEVRENLINQYIKCRKEKNMTQEDVAERKGVPKLSRTNDLEKRPCMSPLRLLGVLGYQRSHRPTGAL